MSPYHALNAETKMASSVTISIYTVTVEVIIEVTIEVTIEVNLSFLQRNCIFCGQNAFIGSGKE